MSLRDIPLEILAKQKTKKKAREDALARAVMVADALGVLAGVGMLFLLRWLYR